MLSQVNAPFWFRLACGIPSISTVYAQAWRRCAQVIHMFVHRQQGSSAAVDWQPAADRHGHRSLLVGPVRRVRVSETRWSHRPPLAGRTDARRCRAHVVRRWEPGREPGCTLVGTDMIRVLANRNHYPLQMAPNAMQFIGCCGHSCVGWRRTSISVRCGQTANRGLFEIKFS